MAEGRERSFDYELERLRTAAMYNNSAADANQTFSRLNGFAQILGVILHHAVQFVELLLHYFAQGRWGNLWFTVAVILALQHMGIDLVELTKQLLSHFAK